MEYLNKIVETIEGLKLQADCAIELITNKSTEVRDNLKKAHKMIQINVFKCEILNKYMNGKGIEIYPEVDVEDFKKWYLVNRV